MLKLKRAPAICVDYIDDSSITLDVWLAAGLDSLTKQDVIDMASRIRYPPKTSRHAMADDTPPIFVPLEVLMVHPSLQRADET